MSHHRNRKRRAAYIPEERYDVDGTLIKNEEAFKPKRWDLKEIVSSVNGVENSFADDDMIDKRPSKAPRSIERGSNVPQRQKERKGIFVL